MHSQGGLPLPGFHHVLEPDWFQHGGEMSPEEFGLKAAKEVEDKILELGPDKVAAFVGARELHRFLEVFPPLVAGLRRAHRRAA